MSWARSPLLQSTCSQRASWSARRSRSASLFAGLNQLADLAHHPELRSAKVVLLGFSGAGALVARFSAYAPTRVAAVIAANAGHFDPYGLDRVDLSPDAAKVPQLVIAGSQDRVSGGPRPYEYFRRHFDRGAPWTFIVQNGTPHCCTENVRPLVLAWLDAVVVRGIVSGGRFGFITKGPNDNVDCLELFQSQENALSGAAAGTTSGIRRTGLRPPPQSGEIERCRTA